MNCTNCNAPSTPGSNYCYHCGQGLHAASRAGQVTSSSKLQKFLLFIAIFVMCEATFWILVRLSNRFLGLNIWRFTMPLDILINLFFAAIPIFAAGLLPRNSASRSALMVTGIIFLSIKFLWTVYYEFIYHSFF